MSYYGVHLLKHATEVMNSAKIIMRHPFLYYLTAAGQGSLVVITKQTCSLQLSDSVYL